MAYNPYLGSFQMPGIASGFDTASVVSKLMEVEMQPLNRAQEKFDTLNYQQKVWMQVDKKLEEFYDFLIEFKLQGNLIPKKAVSSDEKVLTASSSADADNATFYLKVNSLASPTVVVGEVTDSTIQKKSTIGSILGIEDDTQEIKFSISKEGGSSKEITLSSTDTINDLIAKIKGSEAVVSAKFDEANGKFFIISDKNGPENISVSAEEGSLGKELLEKLGLLSGVTTTGSYAEVELSFDGINPSTTYEQLNENTINIFGTTIELKSLSDEFVKISVEQDIDKSVDTVKQFVDKYNETITYVYDLLHESKVTDKAAEDMTEEDYMKGILARDRNLENIFYKLRNMVYSSTNVDGEFKSLLSIGIGSGDTGRNYESTMKGLIKLDEDKLREALNNNPEDVWKLFATNDKTNEKYGVAQKIQNYVYDVTKFNGYIDRIAGTNGTIGNQMRSLAKEMTNLLDKLQKKEAYYYARFTAMEQAVQKLSMQGAYIQNAFSKQNQ